MTRVSLSVDIPANTFMFVAYYDNYATFSTQTNLELTGYKFDSSTKIYLNQGPDGIIPHINSYFDLLVSYDNIQASQALIYNAFFSAGLACNILQKS